MADWISIELLMFHANYSTSLFIAPRNSFHLILLVSLLSMLWFFVAVVVVVLSFVWLTQKKRASHAPSVIASIRTYAEKKTLTHTHNERLEQQNQFQIAHTNIFTNTKHRIIYWPKKTTTTATTAAAPTAYSTQNETFLLSMRVYSRLVFCSVSFFNHPI